MIDNAARIPISLPNSPCDWRCSSVNSVLTARGIDRTGKWNQSATHVVAYRAIPYFLRF
jgi:hypothetical protein